MANVRRGETKPNYCMTVVLQDQYVRGLAGLTQDSLSPDHHIRRIVKEVNYILTNINSTLEYKDREIY